VNPDDYQGARFCIPFLLDSHQFHLLDAAFGQQGAKAQLG
jgi:hypothetical protein